MFPADIHLTLGLYRNEKRRVKEFEIRNLIYGGRLTIFKSVWILSRPVKIHYFIGNKYPSVFLF